MTKFKAFIKNNKHALFMVYWPFHTLWYGLIRIFSDVMPSFFLVESSWDKSIPYISVFALPYSIWFLYIFGVLFYTFKQNKRDFINVNLMIIGCMFFSMIIATVMPNGLAEGLQPAFEQSNLTLLDRLVKFIHETDSPPRAVFPSMHVSVALCLGAVVVRGESFRKKWLWKISLSLLSISICLSTVYIKQHSVVDIFGGTLMFLGFYIVVYHILPNIKSPKFQGLFEE